MPRMLDLIRESAVPANLMRSASKGALSLPAAEMVEILVWLSGHQLFGEQARMTLAQWDESSSREIASDPNTPATVLAYLADPANLRPPLFAALVANPGLPDEAWEHFAERGSRETVEYLLRNPQTANSAKMLHLLCRNQNVRLSELEELEKALARLIETDPEQEAQVVNRALADFHREYKDDLAAEESRPFELFRYQDDEEPPDILEDFLKAGSIAPTAVPERAVVAPSAHAQALSAAAHRAKPDPTHLSPLQKIAKMKVGERVQLAMKGSKDERFILIRDGSKVVSTAVLESPKVTEQEVESFATMKNVQESVLRGIAQRRKFRKLYPVVRSLCSNPRTPVDVSLALLKELLVMDLRALTMNKNVSDTVRKIALKLYKDRTETRK